MGDAARVLPMPSHPPTPTQKRKRRTRGPSVFRRLLDRMKNVHPGMIDLGMALAGTVFVSVGLGLVFLPAGLVAAGLGLFYLGAWHR